MKYLDLKNKYFEGDSDVFSAEFEGWSCSLGDEDVQRPGQVRIWELCVGKSWMWSQQNMEEYRTASEPRAEYRMIQNEFVLHPVLSLSPQSTQRQVEQL